MSGGGATEDVILPAENSGGQSAVPYTNGREFYWVGTTSKRVQLEAGACLTVPFTVRPSLCTLAKLYQLCKVRPDLTHLSVGCRLRGAVGVLSQSWNLRPELFPIHIGTVGGHSGRSSRQQRVLLPVSVPSYHRADGDAGCAGGRANVALQHWRSCGSLGSQRQRRRR